ncbi:hypothetical protein DH2020_020582 [Rehmannia glutinosa]|uniref:Protein FAR1-RELATED SEQUENCE n=1 Tax=Rehmannia glutinosa TaxID=99300 RepID=A0ABR0WGN0_REHGL
MGNCHAAEAATMVVQHPGGNKVDRIYWSVSANEIMNSNPGHYVVQVVAAATAKNGLPAVKQVKLLRPDDTLVIGQVYRLISFEDLITTQRSESMNSVLKRYVSYKHNLLQFFHHFDRLVDDRRYQELKADLRTSQSTPVVSFPVQILKHAASIYTHEVFELFQDELHKAYDSKAELSGENGETCEYKVIPFKKNYQHTVIYVSSQNEVSCSCKKFEFAGILCSHALKVLSLRNIVKIPDLYIKKRWTKKAKRNIVEGQFSGVSVELSESMNENEEKKMIGVHYKELWGLNNQLASRAAVTAETFKIAKNGLIKLIEEVDASLENRQIVRPTLGPKSIVKKNIVSNVEEKQNVVRSCPTDEYKHESDDIIIRGWKKKEKKSVRSGKRPRSGLEKSTQKKRKSQRDVSLSNSAILHTNQNVDSRTNSPSIDPPIEHNSLPSLSQLSEEYRVGRSNFGTRLSN